MRNIKLTLAYDGTDFHGWQIQPGQSTIQGTLTDVAEKLTQQVTTIYMARGAPTRECTPWARSRTSRRRQGSTQVDFQRAFNALLPPIRFACLSPAEVGPDFHSR